MGPGGLHLHQQVEGRHGRRGEEHRAQDAGEREGRREIDAVEARKFGWVRRPGRVRHPRQEIHEVADVDHAARIIKRVAIDWNARMSRCAENGQHFGERGVGARADDVGARHHHIGHAQFVEGQDILEDQPFLRREVVGGGGLLQRVLDIFAHRGPVHAEQGPQSVEEPGLVGARGAGCVGAAHLSVKSRSNVA